MKKLSILLMGLLLGSLSFGQNKVAGFYPNWYAESTLYQIQWDKLTDVLYAFGDPQNTGGISITNEARLTILSNEAHANGVKCHLSFGGAAQGDNGWASIASNATYRQTFAQNVAQKVITHNLDGIDLDWEFPDASQAAGYADIAVRIRAELDAIESTMGRRIELTAAVAPVLWNNDGINTTFINTMDYLYVMSFDGPACHVCGGPNHSSFTLAQNAFLHWTTGIPGETNTGKGADPSKLILAIPFYDNAGAFYKDFSNSDPAGYYNDADGYYGGNYYNSRPMIEQKGDYVMQNGGSGLWTWELVQDRADQYSLLNVMYTKVNEYGCSAPAPVLGEDQSICGVGSITLNSNVSTAAGRTFTWKRNGVTQVNGSSTATTYNATQSGTYLCEVTEGGCTTSDEIVISGTIPAPDLAGPYDLCDPASITLDAGVTGGGLTYQWRKNGTNITGETNQLYTASSAGTFTVVVSASGCTSVQDNVTVTSSLPTVVHDTICAAGTVTLSANSSVEWYDAQTNGSLVFNGVTYTPNISSSTTYWVKESGVSSTTYTTMRSAFQGDGWQQDPLVYATRFDVLTDLTLDQVTVNAGASGNVTINIVNVSDPLGTPVATKTVSISGGLNPIDLGFVLAPGSYYIQAVGTAVTLYTDITAAGNFNIAGVITVYGDAYWDWSDPRGDGYAVSGQYGNYINMKVTVGGSCARTPVYAVIDAGHSSCTNTPPTANFASSTTSTCVGNSITFTDASTGGEPTSWSWNFGTNASPATATGKGPHVVTYSSTGTKTVTLNVSNAFGSDGETKTNFITITNTPNAAGSITGLASICEGTSTNYSIASVANATDYTWTVPTGATIVSGQGTTSIAVDFTSSVSGNITVTPSNGCGNGTAASRYVTVNPLPGAAGAISGNNTVCFNANSESYSASAALNATSYTWTVPTGATIVSGQGTNGIVVDFTGASSGNISITPTNSCGSGATQNFAVTIANSPGAAGIIVGSSSICPGQTGVVYSLAPVSGATNYTWTVPSGATIVSGQGTTDLTVDFSSTGGTIEVTPSNSCGSGTSSNTSVSVSGTTIPVSEDFESGFPSTGWSVNNNDADVTWTTTSVGGNGTSATSIYMNFRGYSGSGQTDEIVTPTLNFSGKSNISLAFTHAYAWYDRGGTNNDKFDELQVLISTDCGSSFTTIWNQNGTTLSTLGGGAGQQANFVPTAAQWRDNVLDLSAYDGMSSVIIKFVGLNGNGNNLYLDDINISGVTLSAPTADFTADITSVCTGNTVTFTDASLNSPSSWSWNFGVGASPAIATGQGPHAVTYSSRGTKTVTLSISNGLGSDDEIKTDYISVSETPASAASISGIATVCDGASETYSITSILGASAYNWTVPTGASITTNSGTSITVDFTGANTGNVTVTPSNSCGSAVTTNLGVTVNKVPDAAGAVSGPVNVCSGENGVAYSIVAVNNATSYTWTVPTGATIASGQGTNAIIVNFSSNGGNVSVTPTSSCGNGTGSTTAVTITTGAGNAGAITGISSDCEGTSTTYSITAVSGASGYSWTVPTGATINSGQGTTSINVTLGSTDGNVSVTPTSSCGNGASTSLPITILTVPNNASALTGVTDVCEGNSEAYSIASVSGATAYNWTVPTGASITANSGTSITVDYSGASNGNITVTPSNSCGDGGASLVAVNLSAVPGNAAAISGATNVCANETGVTYSIASVIGATAYDWTIPAGAIIVSNSGASITVDFGTTGGNITVTPMNSCGNGGMSSSAVTITNGAADAGAITGVNSVCANETGVSYSIAAVAGASGYTWTVPTGASISSGNNTNVITVDFGTSGGNISVTPISSCGDGAPSTINVSTTATPDAAGVISGLTSVCDGGSHAYTVSAVAGATSYNWTVPTGASITSNSGTSITVDFTGATSGNISVTPVNTCGTGTISNLGITVGDVPSAAGTITGISNVCANQTGVTYSIAAVAGATSYNWTVPTGTNITTNNGTSITVTIGTNSGNITVTPVNSCGNGIASNLAISINGTVGNAGAITGLTNICANEAGVAYFIAAVTNATSYNWSVPTGASIISNTGTNIQVDFGTNGGNVSVTPTNSCGSGLSNSSIVSISPNPGNAGGISGNTVVCIGEVTNYNIAAVSGATSYDWTVPTGATITSNTSTSITVDFTGSTSGNISVTPTNSCGTGGNSITGITVNTIPNNAGAITGASNVCSGETGITFTVTPVTGATSYNWTVPTGATITSGAGTNSITVSFGSNGGNVTVQPSNTCGNSASAASLGVVITNGAADAGVITGTSLVCSGETGVVFSIDPVTGASGYSWTVPAGAIITNGLGTNSITVTFGSSAGNVSVTPTSSCGNGVSSSLPVSMNAVPTSPGPIAGASAVCVGNSHTFSISPVTGASSYTWVVPAGATIISGQGGLSIEVDFTGASSGNITVAAENTCGTSASSVLGISVSDVPTAAGFITGNTTICENENGVAYSIDPIPTANSYVWSLPTGAIVATGDGTEAITVDFGTNPGNLVVTPVNACGNGATSTKTVSITNGAGDAGAITGNTDVCPNEMGLVYTVGAVAGANGYTWIVPAGATITSGDGTNSIIVDLGANGGNVSVTPTSSCGNGTLSSTTLTVGSIPTGTGLMNVAGVEACEGDVATYSLSGITGATNYLWTVPTGATITSGQGTNVVAVDYAGAISGDVTVTPSNVCGDDATITRSVSITGNPGDAGAITGITTVCSGEIGVTYDIATVTGATSYNWTVPTDATITSGQGTNAITVTFGTTGGNVSVTPSNSCTNGASNTVAISITTGAGDAGVISGLTNVCEGATGVVYDIAAVTGASGYTWAVPADAAIVSGQGTNSIVVDFGTTASNITVTPTSSCGNGNASFTTITLNASPNAAGVISGVQAVCDGEVETYSIANVIGATSYAWTVPTGASVTSGQGTNTISVNFAGATSGNVSVTPENACGSGTNGTLAIVVSNSPAAAGAISGLTAVCIGETGVSYSIPVVAGATGYNWIVPAGATIASGDNTESITLNFASNAGTVSVEPSNSCGTGTVTSLPVSLTTGAGDAGVISGTDIVCEGETGVSYSIATITGASGYTWSVPVGANIVSGQGTNLVTVDFGTISGNMSVTPTSSCGDGSVSSLPVTIESIPVDAGTINGSTTVCSGSIETYEVTPIGNATGYNWTLPTGALMVADNGNSIDVDFSSALSGDVTVTPLFSCGITGTSTLSVSISNTSTPGAITGITAPCENATGEVYSITTVAGAIDYIWTVPASATITAGQGTNSITIDYSSITSGDVSVVVESSCGLSNPSVLTVSPVTCGIHADFTMDVTNLCESGAITFTDASTGANGKPNYTWDFGNGVTANTAGPHVINYNTPGTYTVSLDVSKGNKGDSEIKTNVIVVGATVNTGAISGNVSIACDASNELFSVANTAGSIYSWTTSSGSIISGQGTNSITVDYTGVFGTGQVEVLESNGACVGTTVIHAVDVCQVTSLNETEDQIDLYLLPNPTSNKFEIGWSGTVQIEEIQILSMNGVVIYKTTNSTEVLGGNLGRGAYLVRLITDHGVYVKKLIKEY